MNQNIGLIQIDGELPNLALMKLSTYHKTKKDNIFLMKDKTICSRLIEFDKVYISCIFEENKNKAIAISKQFKNAEVGGIGVNNKILPENIEHLQPDYDLYKLDYSMGFVTRGCLRNCPFCKVPKQEGMIRVNTDIYEFWNPKHKHIVLLDNNILASPKHFEKISDQIIKENLSVDFNQGLDIRLLNNKNVKILSKLKINPYCRFAFDSMAVKKYVIKGLELLEKYNIKGNMWYVLVGFDTSFEEDMERLLILKKHKQKPYVMRFNKVRGQEIYNDLSAWVNQQQFFSAMDFDTYCKIRHNRANLISSPKKTPKNTISLETFK